MPFERLAPQVVRHSDGFTVQVADRYHVEYIEGQRRTLVAADLDGDRVRVHGQSLAWTNSEPMSDEDRLKVLDLIRQGLEAMGDLCEVID